MDLRRQALQIALHATWLSGLLFIVVSLYAIELLTGIKERGDSDSNAAVPSIIMFTVPDPFEGFVGDYQSQAIHSWLRLSQGVQVILVGQHASLNLFASDLHPRVVVDSDIDFTFSGVPLVHSLIARAGSSSSDVSVLLDAQFILTEDFVDTIEYAYSLKHDWILVAMARTSPTFPFQLKSFKNIWMKESGQSVRDAQVQAYIKRHGTWHNCTGRYLWAWNTGSIPLHIGVMPSFMYGHGFHHEWLLNEALSSGSRFVFDASSALTAFYQSLPESYSKVSWGIDNNAYLAAIYGSFFFKPVYFMNAPPKLVRCGDPSLKIFQFLYPSFSAKISASYMSLHLFNEMSDASTQELQSESFLTSFRRFGPARMEGSVLQYLCYSVEHAMRTRGHSRKGLEMERLKVDCDCSSIRKGELKLDCPLSKMKWLPKPMSSGSTWMVRTGPMFKSLGSLLAEVSSNDKIVIVSVVANNYRDMLMNWVCRLRKLAITNFIIGAVDKDLFDFAVLQGLPVFMAGPSMSVSFNDCHFGTNCFKNVTKMKSSTVLQILKLGYSVLFSDVDVYWFRDPRNQLMSFGPGTVAAQSDEWNVTEPPNKPRRLNSGFYFVWSHPSTIAVFEKIVEHASMSSMSEQPSFYDVLCGESGRYRQGNWQCQEPHHNVTTHFLDRKSFPNGAFLDLWTKENVSEACRLQGCYVLHNNWIGGRQKKFKRQIASGLWDYDAPLRICLRVWQRPMSRN